jgi:hypothetical protein
MDRSYSPSQYKRGAQFSATGHQSNFGTNENADYTNRLAYSPSQGSQLPGGDRTNHVNSEYDPYAPAIVQDLLHGTNEWKNIQDIVKLTFKAVCDVVRS